MCDGNLTVFCVRVRADISLYIGLHETVDVFNDMWRAFHMMCCNLRKYSGDMK